SREGVSQTAWSPTYRGTHPCDASRTCSTEKGRIIISATDSNLQLSAGHPLQLGYMFNRNWGVEGGWVDLGEIGYRATATNFGGASLNANVNASGFNIAGIGVMPLNDSFSLFAKLGTINAKVKASGSVAIAGVTFNANQSDTSWSNNYGLGVMYNLSAKTAIRAEWERFSKLGDKNKTDEGDIDLLSLGLKYSF
ncbi:MAG: hypothetical protein EXR28_16275, partial [Betaproteobacteria bacterium]|nr:hypothetical protein [Betaproteobacteria bacterium]